MTRRTVEAVEKIPSLPLLEEHEEEKRVGLLLITGDRGLAGAFNSQILRAGNRRAQELEAEGKEIVWYASGRRGVSSLSFRGREVAGAWQGFTDRPAFSNARDIAGDIATQYIDGKVDRVELVFNHYVSPLTQDVRTDTLLPLQEMAQLVAEAEGEAAEDEVAPDEEGSTDHARSLWIYEPDPEEILQRLVPDYIEIIHLQGAARVNRLRARRANDRDAQRAGECRRDDRGPHARDEPSAPGRDHAGDHGSRGRG